MKRIIPFVFLILFSACQKNDDTEIPETPEGSSIRLNKSDSLVMVKFHESIGGLGWDLNDCNTWDFVTFEYDPKSEESYVIAIQCGIGFMQNKGELTKELGKLSRLRIFFLQDLSHLLSGELPAEIFNCPLQYFHVEADVFGELTSDVGKIAGTIEHFYIQGSYLSGQLPREFGLFQNLKSPLGLLNNRFSGFLPKEFSSIKKGVFLVQNNISSVEWEFFDVPKDKAWEVMMWNNRLKGEIPDHVFETEYWKAFSHNFTSQQEGYGFSNFRFGK